MTEQVLEEIKELLSELVNKPAPHSPGFMTLEQSAKFSGLSVKSLRRLISASKLTAHRPVKGRILLDRQELITVIRSSANARPRIRRSAPAVSAAS